MLTISQRIDLLKLAADLAKADRADAETPIAEQVTQIFETLRAAAETGDLLDATTVGDVDTALNVAVKIGDLIG